MDIPCWPESNTHSNTIYNHLLAKPELGTPPAQACFDDLTFPVPLGSQSCSLTILSRF